MYFIDFCKRMTRKANIPVLIYLILNVFVISIVTELFLGSLASDGEMPFWQALLIGIVLYAISLMIALSPFGEWILRLQTGCKKIKREDQKEFIMPIFKNIAENSPILVWEMNRLFPLLKYEKLLVHTNIPPDTR